MKLRQVLELFSVQCPHYVDLIYQKYQFSYDLKIVCCDVNKKNCFKTEY